MTVSGITATSAVITWDTDEAADSRVDYGPTVAYENGSVTSASLVTSHSLSLTGLTPSTEYHFRVRSKDAAFNERFSGDFTFTTAAAADTTAPVITNVQAVDITTSGARITWDTDEASDGFVDFGPTVSYGTTLSNASLVTSHSVALTGLTDATLYHFRVRSRDAALNEAVSGDATFTTTDDPPPGNVSGLSVTAGDGQNQLSWTNPPDADLTSVRVIACTNEAPSGPNDPDCSVVFEALGSSFTHSGLTNGTTYFYGVFIQDAVGQFSSGALGQGTPSAPEEELPPEEPPPEVLPPEEPPPITPPPGGGVACGDGICSETESSSGACPVDCPVPTPLAAACGNAVCEAGEDNASCAEDCPLGLPAEPVLRQDLELLAAGFGIRLPVSDDGSVKVLGATPLRVQLLVNHLERQVDRVELTIGSSVYLMAPNFSSQERPGLIAAAVGDDAFVADVMTPETSSTYPATIAIQYTDGSAQSIPFLLDVRGDGYAYALIEGAEQRISSAKVTLYAVNGARTAWDGSPYGQFNPTTAGGDGSFAWYVQNGRYAVRVEALGYEPSETAPFSVTDHIANPRVRLTLVEEVPPPVIVPPLLSSITETAQQTLEAVRDIPAVQTAADVSVPALAATAAATTVTLALGFNLLPLLQYSFTAPILFFNRRRRRGFGVVYNAISKIPLDLATVRLFRLPDAAPAVPGEPEVGRLVQSRVTDKGGRYFFLADPGRYRIVAMKQGFAFPTEYVKDVKVDAEYLDIYHSEPIVVSEKGTTISANVPMDPSQAEQFQRPARIVWMGHLRVLQNTVATLGVILSIAFAVIRPTAITIGLVVLQAVVYLLVRRLAKPRKPDNWGIVYDKATVKPLGRVVVRVFEPRYNKLLETAVTDGSGRYNFVLGPNEYYVVFDRAGYQPVEVRPVDYSRQKEPSEFGVKVYLPPRPAGAI
ncbi:hypothetical protein A2856_01125 [Candidatus Uhrbacteria bacterium RIFCSPHIGHO2_01_FULL_63_20]|uniref:Fibronectin type-III domain-containing protein n=1 Tax=Candidatus Uhrbacteria bacterium RIFCSPHIGHO2_01_FULL_63_20 TaxID=1802385 RepID=A0A1F7TM66_9BACT|nr:MAG: hypothetical protein A2856_01125 [Candidatus Uhrbacteria bacterium RIFCSPHIGHO2_01_FULL_63_20]